MITLSKRHIKGADRCGGIELLIPWPAELGDHGMIDQNSERDATPAERAWVDAHVQPACRSAGLVAGRAVVGHVLGPDPSIRATGWHYRIVVRIIHPRWVGAGGDPIPVQKWYLGDA